MHGWLGEGCQIISSVFDKSTITARSQSRHSVICSIYKLWYSWTSVYLAVYNGTETLKLINVSQSDVITSSDQRMNASLQRATRMYEADTVSFLFELREDDCDLQGVYECQFEMIEKFNTSFGNLSLLVQELPTDLQIWTKNEYVLGSTDNIKCTFQSSSFRPNVSVIFFDRNNITRGSTEIQVHQHINASMTNCKNWTELVFQFNATQELHQLTAKCLLIDSSAGILIESDGAVVNVVSGIVSVLLEPKRQVAAVGSTVQMFCYANISHFNWKVIHLDFTNSLSSQRLISVLYNETNKLLGDIINATIISSDATINISYIFNITDEAMVCSMEGEYSCDIEFTEDAVQTTSNKGTLAITVPPSITEFVMQDYYYSISNHSVSCTAIFGENSTTRVQLQICLENSYKPIKDDLDFFLIDILENGVIGKCTRQKTALYMFNFTQISNGTSLRCLAADHKFNTTVTTECSPLLLQHPVQIKMEPTVLSLIPNITTELVCAIPYKGYAWSSVNILQQNSKSSLDILSVLNNGSVISNNSRVNGSVIISAEYINVTVAFDARPGSGLCDLNQTYTCDINLLDSHIGSIAANSTLMLEIPVTNVNIYLLPQYQYGIAEWVNCTANMMDSSKATVYLEVCYNESKFLPIENILTSLEDSFSSNNENCSVQKMMSQRFIFNSKSNVSMRCRVYDQYSNSSKTSYCFLPNISTPSVHVVLQPKYQVGLLGSTVQMFCIVNVSHFSWKVIHLDFRNSSSTRRLISVFHNETNNIFEKNIIATVITNEATVNISYMVNIIDYSIMCSMDGEYSCDIEFTDEVIQTTYDKGILSVTARPNITEFVVPDYYYSISNHSLSCTAIFGHKSTTALELEICSDGAYKSITDDSRFTLSPSSNDEVLGKCTRQKTVSYNFNFTQVSNGTYLRCVGTDNNLDLNVTTECVSLILQLPVVVNMSPAVLSLRPNTTTELVCSIPYRGYKWSSVHILQQNSSDSAVVLVVSSDGTVITNNTRVNGSVNISAEYVNITVTFDTSSGPGLCRLNQSYICDINLIDSSIGTVAANSTLVLQVPVSDVAIHLQTEYQYGTADLVNCTANMMDSSTVSMFLEACYNESTFLPIDNISSWSIWKSENCSVQKIESMRYIFNSKTNVSMRCRVYDRYSNTSTTSNCYRPNISTPLAVRMEPDYQTGLQNSTIEIACNAYVGNNKWKTINLDYAIGSTKRRILSFLPNNSSPIIGNDVNATVLSINEIVNVSFVLRITEDVTNCNIEVDLSCSFEFQDKTVETINSTGTIVIKATPTNLSIEIENTYYGVATETINCTAVINPNTTDLFLIGRGASLREPIIAPAKDVQIYVQHSEEAGCNPKVRKVFRDNSDFLKDNNVLACMASDKEYGKNFTSEFKTASVSISN